jgi:hypothetical protein
MGPTPVDVGMATKLLSSSRRSPNASRGRIANQRHEIGFAAPRTDRAPQGQSTRGGKRAPARNARAAKSAPKAAPAKPR